MKFSSLFKSLWTFCQIFAFEKTQKTCARRGGVGEYQNKGTTTPAPLPRLKIKVKFKDLTERREDTKKLDLTVFDIPV